MDLVGELEFYSLVKACGGLSLDIVTLGIDLDINVGRFSLTAQRLMRYAMEGRELGPSTCKL
eukprot:4322093-Prorocentrum_lima.AAC.1